MRSLRQGVSLPPEGTEYRVNQIKGATGDEKRAEKHRPRWMKKEMKAC